MKNCLARFRKNDEGSAPVIEFVVMVPLIFSTFIMSVELGIYSMRQMFLDRGLDMVTREIRLNTGTVGDHATLKDMVCEASGFLPECKEKLKLEMITVDPRNFAELDPQPDCIDTKLGVTPVRGWDLGREHELMMLRACYKFDPLFPTTGLGLAFAKDGSGEVAMISLSVFVQEPG
ncbi:TadE/TadG family type IV pilus assembly protein [Sulfitobacter sp. S190]|uniref:TadE/TadG family type IV pilus assembly protein n=1 Tax=Sulfitobacter sp. S190 TaxID=2867022 RepID=UPI0021A930A9|nr:pilus assembly protein [Sulfitobacter sp. S190]